MFDDPLFDVLRTLPAEEILCHLWDVICADFQAGFDLFACRLFKSEHHIASIRVFANWYDMYGETINTIGVLSTLATIFTDEPIFADEYSRVCDHIKGCLGKH